MVRTPFVQNVCADKYATIRDYLRFQKGFLRWIHKQFLRMVTNVLGKKLTDFVPENNISNTVMFALS